MKTISDIEKLDGREMLAWMTYPPAANTACQAAPQAAVNPDGTLSQVDPDVFPGAGKIGIGIKWPADSDALKSTYGEIAVVKITDRGKLPNRDYNPDSGSVMKRNRYYTQYDGYIAGGGGADAGAILLTVAGSQAAASLYQVIEVGAEADLTNRTDTVAPLDNGEAPPATDKIMLQQTRGTQILLFGPFDYTIESDGTLAVDATEGMRYRIAEFRASDLPDILKLHKGDNASGDIAARFVSAGDVIAADKRGKARAKHDWITDAQLVDTACTLMNQIPSVGKDTVRSFRNAVSSLEAGGFATIIDEERRKRLEAVLSRPERWADLGEGLDQIMSSPLVQDKIGDIISDKTRFKKLKPMLMDNPKVQQQLEEEVRAERAELERVKKQAKRKADELKQVERRLADKNAELEKMRQGALAEAEKEKRDLEKEKDRIRREIKKLGKAKDAAEDSYRKMSAHAADLAADINALSDEAAARIADDAFLGSLIAKIGGGAGLPAAAVPAAGRAGGPAGADPAGGPIPQPVLRSGSKTMGKEKILDAVCREMAASGGREVSPEDAANLMVCLMQGYLTVLAGPPGCGKTSLCQIAAGALGLRQEGANRFCEISVERGWTSYRDFIGYANPITGTLEKTNQDVFDAMALLDAEARSAAEREAGGKKGNDYPYLFLLDEANLSPIEHYWSPFLKACDDFRSGTRLVLGADASFSLPGHARFLATLNSDHTTEQLSPRLLDRSWVITLAPHIVSLDAVEADPPGFGAVPAIPYDALLRTFDDTSKAAPEAVMSGLERAVGIFAEHGRPLSPRSQKMMLRYVRAASAAMPGGGEDLAPLDFALSQKALPAIAGTAAEIEPLVSALAAEFADLPRTAGHLERMERQAQDHGYCSFL